MAFAEKERVSFYNQDSRKYDISQNKDFLRWLKSSQDNGYHSFINMTELQKLIDYIVRWYELKYPERDLQYLDDGNGVDTEFSDINTISDKMDFGHFLYVLLHNQLCLMKCKYRSNGGFQYPVYKDGKVVKWNSSICVNVGKKKEISIQIDDVTGEVTNPDELDEYLNVKKKIKAEELLSLLESFGKIDFSELRKCVDTHKRDLELRKKTLQLAALKILYSENTTPERGYERAKRFIKEFNDIKDIDLSTDEIDEIIHRDYSVDMEIPVGKFKRLARKMFGNNK